ncbi:hypothetical protein ADEAN_000110700 [Angomonas deanei]|uniref:Uncharacterized protein n=1 Tax=Angomonas deanei TaxID=59799 RepID=A0A7G2C329_9TRYP|nr:hypothetical protein ADEAN_000110700 [Angomonas deanei]
MSVARRRDRGSTVVSIIAPEDELPLHHNANTNSRVVSQSNTRPGSLSTSTIPSVSPNRPHVGPLPVTGAANPIGDVSFDSYKAVPSRRARMNGIAPQQQQPSPNSSKEDEEEEEEEESTDSEESPKDTSAADGGLDYSLLIEDVSKREVESWESKQKLERQTTGEGRGGIHEQLQQITLPSTRHHAFHNNNTSVNNTNPTTTTTTTTNNNNNNNTNTSAGEVVSEAPPNVSRRQPRRRHTHQQSSAAQNLLLLLPQQEAQSMVDTEASKVNWSYVEQTKQLKQQREAEAERNRQRAFLTPQPSDMTWRQARGPYGYHPQQNPHNNREGDGGSPPFMPAIKSLSAPLVGTSYHTDNKNDNKNSKAETEPLEASLLSKVSLASILQTSPKSYTDLNNPGPNPSTNAENETSLVETSLYTPMRRNDSRQKRSGKGFNGTSAKSFVSKAEYTYGSFTSALRTPTAAQSNNNNSNTNRETKNSFYSLGSLTGESDEETTNNNNKKESDYTRMDSQKEFKGLSLPAINGKNSKK